VPDRFFEFWLLGITGGQWTEYSRNKSPAILVKFHCANRFSGLKFNSEYMKDVEREFI